MLSIKAAQKYTVMTDSQPVSVYANIEPSIVDCANDWLFFF